MANFVQAYDKVINTLCLDSSAFCVIVITAVNPYFYNTCHEIVVQLYCTIRTFLMSMFKNVFKFAEMLINVTSFSNISYNPLNNCKVPIIVNLTYFLSCWIKYWRVSIHVTEGRLRCRGSYTIVLELYRRKWQGGNIHVGPKN